MKKINLEKIFSHLVTAVLLGMAYHFQNTAIAYAAVASSAITAAYSIYSRLVATKEQKPSSDDNLKRLVQDTAAKVATIEYGIKQRGF